MHKIQYIFLIFGIILTFLFSSMTIKPTYSINSMKNQQISTLLYQNETISYPSFLEGQFINTYTQYGKLLLLPFETDGSWISPIYTETNFYLYSWITICQIPMDASLTGTLLYNNGGGWLELPMTLNYTFNQQFNGENQFLFIFNLTKIQNTSVLLNFTAYYIHNIEIPIIPYIFFNIYLEVSIIFILFFFIIFIYRYMHKIWLMSIAYLIYLPISVESLWNLSMPFYPFVQLFCLAISSYLFVDLVLTYEKQVNKVNRR